MARQYFETACALAGIAKDTGYRWLKIGDRREWEAQGRDPTELEALCGSFSDALTRAWAFSEARDIEGIVRAGTEPGVETTKTVVKERSGQGDLVIVKETTTTRTSPPDAANLRWHAQHRFAPRWSERHRVEVSGPEEQAVPVELDIDKIMDSLATLRAIDAGVVEPSSNGHQALPAGSVPDENWDDRRTG